MRREDGGRGPARLGCVVPPAVPSAGPVLALAVPIPAVKKHAAKTECVIGPESVRKCLSDLAVNLCAVQTELPPTRKQIMCLSFAFFIYFPVLF